MKITVIGTGYVGLVTGTIFAEVGNEVTCVDIDPQKINQLKTGQCPIYEPGLPEIIKKNIDAERLVFTTTLAEAVPDSQVIFIAVGTPSDKDGQADLKFVKEVAAQIGKILDSLPAEKRGYKIIVNKSTVPVGTGDLVGGIVQKFYQGDFDVVSNPEFLREGSAVHDCLQPDRVVVGLPQGEGHSQSAQAQKIMTELYQPFKCPVLFADIKSAEIIKYASNSFLAMEISYINAIANLCEIAGGDVEKVAAGMRLDSRIGAKAFLSAGAGYGGSCFPKDVKALIKTAELHGYNFSILRAAEDINARQKRSLITKTTQLLGSNLAGKTIAVWGLAFKPNTDDMREATALTVIPGLRALGATLRAYDPVAQAVAKKIMPDIEYTRSPLEAIQGADALVILTEWEEFKKIPLEQIKNALNQPVIIDGRNIFDPAKMKTLGFEYLAVGRTQFSRVLSQQTRLKPS